MFSRHSHNHRRQRKTESEDELAPVEGLLLERKVTTPVAEAVNTDPGTQADVGAKVGASKACANENTTTKASHQQGHADKANTNRASTNRANANKAVAARLSCGQAGRWQQERWREVV